MNKELVRVKKEVDEKMARKVNDNTLNDNPGNSGEVNEDLVAVSGKTCTDVTGNKVVQEDDETMKVTKNVVDDPPEKHAPDTVLDSREGEQITYTEALVIEQPNITLSQSAQYCKSKIKNDQIGVDEVLSNELTKTLPKID
ncbi:hypothetical protein CASFOL_027290 [Castilleja foliolosa]|uniref:Uncharacterized protein n=1 Tax=Castilleja foliolosa TaxID=1961234 RepID=A0ABD3CFC7_9LAMI